jgi:small-conductance mechanosensitive channel
VAADARLRHWHADRLLEEKVALGKTLPFIRHGQWLILFCCLVGTFASWTARSLAAQPQDPAHSDAETVTQYPDFSQFLPLSTALDMEAAEAKKQISKWSEPGVLKAQIDENQRTILALDQNLAGWGHLGQWSEMRLLDARQRLIAVRDRQASQLDKLAIPFKSVEELQRDWTGKREFWNGWQVALKRDGIKVPAEVFAKNRAAIEEVISRAMSAMAANSELQEKFSAQQEVVASWLMQVDDALKKLHGPLLERNAPVLFSLEFLGQFNHSLWVGLQEDLSRTVQLPDDFALNHGWIAIVQLIIALLVAWQLFQRARAPQPIPDKWQFLFRHPVAGGLFITLIAGTFLSASPPPFWRLMQLVLGTIAATVLVCAMLERPRLRRVIITLAVLYACSSTIQMVGLVQPLHRLFLAGVCVIAAPLCLAAARRQKKRNDGRLDLLAVAFYLGAAAGSVGLVAQIIGYADLTDYLVNTLLGTTFIFVFARMALHLGKGAISALLEVETVSKHRFVRRLGPETGSRLNGLLHVIIITYALLFLLVRWRVYITPAEAWKGVCALTFKIGELQFSMEIVLMVACVLYLTIIISWIIQAFLDAGVMTPQGMEHGVKVAVKTLVHYSLILVGFLVAISVAGVDMSKFAILAGALGVGIGFGLQNIVNNFISGLILLFERPVKVGDTVTLEDQWGIITRIGLRSTVVETADHSEVIVPNSELISQRVVNWTFTSHVTRVVLPVGVAYGTPLDKVLEILLQVAGEHSEIVAKPEPSAIFTGFGDSAINFELRVWIADVNQRLRIRSELGLAIDRHFRTAGIVIPFPQRDLHLQSIAPTLQGLAPQLGSDATTSAKGPDA